MTCSCGAKEHALGDKCPYCPDVVADHRATDPSVRAGLPSGTPGCVSHYWVVPGVMTARCPCQEPHDEVTK